MLEKAEKLKFKDNGEANMFSQNRPKRNTMAASDIKKFAKPQVPIPKNQYYAKPAIGMSRQPNQKPKPMNTGAKPQMNYKP